MANKSRLLTNIMNNNAECRKVFDSIAKSQNTHPTLLHATTPIPNQAFANEENYYNDNATIHFSQKANDYINFLRNLDHYITTQSNIKPNQAQPLKFCCFGYKDLDGDIVITSVSCPIYEEAKEQGYTTKAQIIDYIIQNMSKKNASIETSSNVFDFLREQDFHKPNPIGTALVALMGTTKHANLENDTYNCISLSELSESVMPYYVPIKADNIISGVIAITPKTISEKYLIANHKADNISEYLQDGSLEVALISYEKSYKTGYVTPINITNVTSAMAETNQGIVPIKISSSYQPTENLYKAHQPNHERSM